MPKASVTRLIERDKVKLINFVLDIEKYPEFIPFCIDSKVYEKKEDDDVVNIIADLTIGKKPFVDTYKSDVKYIKNQDLIHVTNIDGPLNYLENNWKFVQKDKFTEVIFDVDFEIKNKFLNIIMTKSFEFGLNKIADAFQKRAEELFNRA
jgi:coenzyme Q-binding protein COQ10